MRTSSLAALLAIAPLPASAHVVLAEPEAAGGSYHAGFFRVSHGCAGSDTISLRITIPATVLSAKPQPKPGWTLSVERQPLPQPVRGEGGTLTTERVSAITWTGRLPADQFDQFGVMMKLPDSPGPLYFLTEQKCTSGEIRWVNIPATGQAWHDVANPAPVLMLTGQDDMAGMHH